MTDIYKMDIITHSQCCQCGHYADLRRRLGSKVEWFHYLSKADKLENQTGCPVPIGKCGIEYDNRYFHIDDGRVDGIRAACCVGPGPFCLMNEDDE